MGRIKLKKQSKTIDRKLLYVVFVLTSLGLIAVADASAPQALNLFQDKFYFVKQQAVWGLLGIVLMFIVARVSPVFWQKIATPLFVASLVLLLLVLVPGVGTKFLGARRWLILGPISIQPSEFVKLALAVYLAKVAAKSKGPFSFFLPLGVVAALVMLQPDLGTTLVILAIGFAQIFVSGLNLVYILMGGLVGIGIGFLAIVTSDYRRNRLLTFLAQQEDPLGRDYHLRQILLALGSGGLFGVGLGQSRQKFLFLPEAATDSIFAIIAEEIGFIGAFLLICLFVFFILRALKIAFSVSDRFAQVLTIGIATWIGGQTFLNIASMVALVPLTGVPLPFFSYGGSALTMVLVACGILLSISRGVHEKK
ncbi:MAG: putative lipid II flippase FtsW [Patescibacteria group bacterium]